MVFILIKHYSPSLATTAVNGSKPSGGYSCDLTLGADLAMESLCNDDRGKLLAMVKSFTFQPRMCTCADPRSYVVDLAHSAVMSAKEVRCEAKIIGGLEFGMPRHFMGHDMYCCCDRVDDQSTVTVRFTMHQWATLGDLVDKIMLVNVKTVDGILDATGDCSAVMHFRKTIPDMEASPLKLGEMFCGGYGGWSQAVKAIQSLECDFTTAWALDCDYMCCKAFANTHHMSTIVTDASQCSNEMQVSEDANLIPTPVFNVEIEKLWRLSYAASLSCQCIAWSAPCPPWSQATNALGLSRKEGMLMIFFHPGFSHVETEGMGHGECSRPSATRALGNRPECHQVGRIQGPVEASAESQ